MKHILILILTVSGGAALAQNWQTVRMRDTNYYNAGRLLPDYGQYGSDTNLLRAMWVDSSITAGGDSVFYFFKGLRIADPVMQCLDTAAPSWLGPKMVRHQSDGRELYFNSNADTIAFMTLAPVGLSWTLVKDISGKVFQGTVSSAGLDIIDGVPDSVKTIAIQAMNGGAPVADYYNGLVFRLSKAHGWIKALDLFRFPNQLARTTTLDVISVDSLQHVRLPKRFGDVDFQHIDMAWRYAAGNEFITVTQINPGGRLTHYDKVVTHDSILSNTIVSPTMAIVTMATKKLSNIWVYTYSLAGRKDSLVSTVTTYTHTDTIVANAASTRVKSFTVGESPLGVPLRGVYYTTSYNRFMVDTLANGLFAFEPAIFGGVFGYGNNCWAAGGYGSANAIIRLAGYVENFGMRHTVFSRPTAYTANDTFIDITYAKMPGCVWGTKINVLALQVPNAGPAQQAAFTVYPNPAADVLTVTNASGGSRCYARLRDFSGSLVLQRSSADAQFNIATDKITSGIYFLEVSTEQQRQVFKMIIRH